MSTNELRVYGASDDLVEFYSVNANGVDVEEFNIYESTTFEVVIDSLGDRAKFLVTANFHTGWELSVRVDSAFGNMAVDVRFDQTDSEELDPMIVFDIPDHSQVWVVRVDDEWL